jgi:hypothetical protein
MTTTTWKQRAFTYQIWNQHLRPTLSYIPRGVEIDLRHFKSYMAERGYSQSKQQ